MECKSRLIEKKLRKQHHIKKKKNKMKTNYVIVLRFLSIQLKKLIHPHRHRKNYNFLEQIMRRAE